MRRKLRRAAGDGSERPTPKQLQFAFEVAQQHQLELPPSVKASAAECSAFIERVLDAGRDDGSTTPDGIDRSVSLRPSVCRPGGSQAALSPRTVNEATEEAAEGPPLVAAEQTRAPTSSPWSNVKMPPPLPLGQLARVEGDEPVLGERKRSEKELKQEKAAIGIQRAWNERQSQQAAAVVQSDARAAAGEDTDSTSMKASMLHDLTCSTDAAGSPVHTSLFFEFWDSQEKRMVELLSKMGTAVDTEILQTTLQHLADELQLPRDALDRLVKQLGLDVGGKMSLESFVAKMREVKTSNARDEATDRYCAPDGNIQGDSSIRVPQTAVHGSSVSEHAPATTSAHSPRTQRKLESLETARALGALTHTEYLQALPGDPWNQAFPQIR